MIRPTLIAVLLLMTAFVSHLARAADTTQQQLEAMPVPAPARVLSIGREVEHNGQLMSLASFDSPQSLLDTAAFYREQWEQAANRDRHTASMVASSVIADSGSSGQEPIPAFIEREVGNWLIMARLQGGFQQLVQLDLSTSHRSEGYLSVMRLTPAPIRSDETLGIPGLELLSTTRSQEPSRSGRLSVYRSGGGTAALSQQLVRFWQQQDWQLSSDRRHEQSRVLMLNRRDAQLDIVISPGEGGQTLIVVNEVHLNEG